MNSKVICQPHAWFTITAVTTNIVSTYLLAWALVHADWTLIFITTLIPLQENSWKLAIDTPYPFLSESVMANTVVTSYSVFTLGIRRTIISSKTLVYIFTCIICFQVTWNITESNKSATCLICNYSHNHQACWNIFDCWDTCAIPLNTRQYRHICPPEN